MTWRKTSPSCLRLLTPVAWNWPSGRFGSVLLLPQMCVPHHRPSPGNERSPVSELRCWLSDLVVFLLQHRCWRADPCSMITSFFFLEVHCLTLVVKHSNLPLLQICQLLSASLWSNWQVHSVLTFISSSTVGSACIQSSNCKLWRENLSSTMTCHVQAVFFFGEWRASSH